MKHSILSIFSIIFCSSISIGQTNVYTLQPDAATGIDATVYSDDVNTNFGTTAEFIGFYWTRSGHDYEGRSLLKFDLSSLPVGQTIVSAKLSLYWDVLSSAGQTLGNNESRLSRITSTWNENTLTWNTLPSVSSTDFITLASSSSATQDYNDLDVTGMVMSMYSNQSTNYGFLFEQVNKSVYRSMKFASSDHTVASKRPKLVITFADTTCTGSITKILQPGPTDGIDAVLKENDPTTPSGNDEEFISYDWSFGGSEAKGISLLKFDLSSLPSNSNIVSAKLSLFYNAASSSAGQYGDNACNLKRITSSWDENTVTWNTPPTTTSVGEVVIPMSSSSSQDYFNIDITGLITTMFSNSSTNYGMMLQLVNSGTYRSMKFCSSDVSNAALRPKLQICYTLKSGITNFSVNNKIQINPNPSSNLLNISSVNNYRHYKIYNQLGKIVKEGDFNNEALSIKELDNGIYFINIDEKEVVKFMVNRI